MPRTVVPPIQMRGAGKNERVGGDGLPERLVKYVPAETLAFFIPVAANIGPHRRAWLFACIIVGLVGTVGYLWLAAQRLMSDQRPLLHFYFLSGVAFLCWVAGTSANAPALIGIDQADGGIVLGFAVFLIPLTDEVLTRWRRR